MIHKGFGVVGPVLSIQIQGDILRKRLQPRQLSCFVSWHPAPERRGAGAVARAAEANPTVDDLCLESFGLQGFLASQRKHQKSDYLKSEQLVSNWCLAAWAGIQALLQATCWAQTNCSSSHPTVAGCLRTSWNEPSTTTKGCAGSTGGSLFLF